MAKIKEREKAQKLRVKGISIADIAQSLGVSKGTVSMWCRDIVLSETAIQNIIKTSKSKSTNAVLRYTELLRKQRQAAVAEQMKAGANMIGDLSPRDMLCIGIGLYWGEGYKKGSQEFGFTNSDPAMITFYIKWLEVVFDAQRKDLILRVSINQLHSARSHRVETYWSNITGVPLNQFTKISLIKTAGKKVYTRNDDHYGTLRIKVRRGTIKRRQVIGAIMHIQSKNSR